MYVESCMILVVCGSSIETRRGTRWTTGLYGLKYDSAIACGLPLYLCSYKLVGSATILVTMPLMVMSPSFTKPVLILSFDFGLIGSGPSLVEIRELTNSSTFCLKCVLL